MHTCACALPDFDPSGDRIPNALVWIASGAVTFGKWTGWFGALKNGVKRRGFADGEGCTAASVSFKLVELQSVAAPGLIGQRLRHKIGY
jgi:hypothetical protein